ncbi:MAG TPA: hypothetical protein VE974_06040 [Thermoanaerobaculia bacterium]|nr:hypothetical protein [Thermoanaerobaculia bacterium]
MRPDELRSALAAFTGTADYHHHETASFSYSDGVKFLADEAGAYWLIELIASWQKRCRKDRPLRTSQVWELRVDLETKSGVLVCLRALEDEVFRISLPFTDFPLAFMRLYLENEVLMLPGER